jgi:hypothetical protein
MIKTINIISFLFLLTLSVLGLFTYHEDMDVKIPFIDTVFVVLGIVAGLLLFFKVNLRWQAIFLGLRQEGFLISQQGFVNAIVYEGINIVFYLLAGLVFLIYVNEIWFVGLILFLHFVEGGVHLIVNAILKPFKIIINEHSIIIIAHAVKIIKWHKIKKVEGKHNDIHFVDENNQIHLVDLDLISESDAAALKQKVKQIATSKKMYCGLV